MAALQLLQQATLPLKVYDRFHSTKVYDTFHSTCLRTKQSGQQSAHMHAAEDGSAITASLIFRYYQISWGLLLECAVLRHPILMHINQYLPPDSGNSS
ncbi:hypothetical protein AVEN_80115-1 [Araneus ventricosus]|uniref:Uncharacterized protein n=1 Tax=Araneus ventricosus TaxID=182803 RepID=A0A4Y2SBG9_ARAVE|nr:hypothetical protein AVEN_80115-1 [Araneus ventricosus]